MGTARYFVLDIDESAPRPRLEGFNLGSGFQTRSVGPTSAPRKSAAAPLKASVVELSPKEVSQERKRTDGRMLERAFPLKLIAPMATASAKPAAASTSTASWGIASTMADKSKFRGLGVTVAVLDTGIDRTHPAFARFTDETLVVRDFTDPAGSGKDENGHGTHCAGTIFGGDVNGTRIGVAPDIERALVGKVIPDDRAGDSAMLFEAIQWASREKANVVSMSLGFDFPGMVAQLVDEGIPQEVAVSNALVIFTRNLRGFDKLMAFIRSSGDMLVVAAAGNESRRAESGEFRISASLPSATDHVVAVGAFGRSGKSYTIAPFSNTDVGLIAPGVDILSAGLGGGLVEMSGTSQACPHIAGLAALWWEKLGSRADPDGVFGALRAAATRAKLPADVDDADCGDGRAVAP